MTLKEIADDALYRVRREGDAALGAKMRGWANQGQQAVCRLYLWDFLKYSQDVTTVPGEDEYALSAETGRIYGVRDVTTNRVLDYAPDMAFDRDFPSQSASGAPRSYLTAGVTRASASSPLLPLLRVYPVPSAALTLRVRSYRDPAALANDADVPAVPAAYHEMLVHYACKTYFLGEGDPRAVTHNDEFEAALRDMVDNLGALPADRLGRLRGASERSRGAVPGRVRMPPNYGA